MIPKMFQEYKASDCFTGNDLIKLWGVSAQDIVDFMRKGYLKAYKFICNKNVTAVKYGLPWKNKTKSQIENEICANIVILNVNNEPLVVDGKINDRVVYRRSEEISIDKRIKQIKTPPSSYREPMEEELNIITRILCESQPDTFFLPLRNEVLFDPISRLFMKDSPPLYEEVKTLYFYRDNINSFADDHCLPLLEPPANAVVIMAPPKEQEVAADKQTTIAAAENYFYHEGNGWRIGFEGEKATFPDRKYIRYVALLIANQGETIRALNLVHAVDGNSCQTEFISENQALDLGLSLAKICRDDEISFTQVREIETLLSDMNQESDPLIKKELKAEYDKKMKVLHNMNRLVDDDGNRAQPPTKVTLDDPHSKKAQKLVRKGLDAAYLAFKKAKLKKLSKHLENSIKTGGKYDFFYSNRGIPWDIKL